MRRALITGCKSGFGRALSERLLRDGWFVVATDPDPSDLAAIATSDAERARLLVLPLDVRDLDQVTHAAAAAGDVDLLVNNGGFAVFGTQEHADLEAMRDLFDVNVLGPARTVQALIAGIRRRKGCVVQISSIAGRMAFPESGFYAATKHSIEAMSEALFEEAGPDGVRVVLIQPGAFQTRFFETASRLSKPREESSSYAPRFASWDARKSDVLAPDQHPPLLVDAIVAAVESGLPFQRVRVGRDSAKILGLKDALSADAWTRLMAWRVGGAPGGGPDDVLSPADLVAALQSGASNARLDATRAAFRAGFLEFWSDLPHGLTALAALAAEDSG